MDARAATAAQPLIGLEASGHLGENLEAALVGAGYRVLVLNPLQTRRYRDVVRRKAKTDDLDAHVIAGLPRSGAAQASYVPDEQIQSLRELARLRARLMADRQDYQRQPIAQLDVVLPEHHAVLGDLLTARARGILAVPHGAAPGASHSAGDPPRGRGCGRPWILAGRRHGCPRQRATLALQWQGGGRARSRRAHAGEPAGASLPGREVAEAVGVRGQAHPAPQGVLREGHAAGRDHGQPHQRIQRAPALDLAEDR